MVDEPGRLPLRSPCVSLPLAQGRLAAPHQRWMNKQPQAFSQPPARRPPREPSGLPLEEGDYLLIPRMRYRDSATIWEPEETDGVFVDYAGRRIRFEPGKYNLLSIILDGSTRTLHSLYSITADIGTRDEVSAILERLLHEGVLVLVS